MHFIRIFEIYVGFGLVEAIDMRRREKNNNSKLGFINIICTHVVPVANADP